MFDGGVGQSDAVNPNGQPTDSTWDALGDQFGDADPDALGDDPVTAYERLVLGGFNRAADDKLWQQQAAEKEERAKEAAATEFAHHSATDKRRLDDLTMGLQTFYREYPALQPERVAAAQADQEMYLGALEQRQRIAHHLRNVSGLTPETAAIIFAAASMLRQKPGSVIPGVQEPEALSKNRHAAQQYLLANLQLLVTPNGIRDFPNAILRRYAGTSQRELQARQLAAAGFGSVPAVLAVLAADIVHSERAAVLATPRIDKRLETTGIMLHAELRRLEAADKKNGTTHARTRLRSIYRDTGQRRAYEEVGKSSRADRDRNTRDDIIHAVEYAARTRYGSAGSNYEHIDVLAELLVADAHNFDSPSTPQHIKDALGERMLAAARRNKIRSADELPAGRAQELFTECMEYASVEGLHRTGSLSPLSILGLPTIKKLLAE